MTPKPNLPRDLDPKHVVHEENRLEERVILEGVRVQGAHKRGISEIGGIRHAVAACGRLFRLAILHVRSIALWGQMIEKLKEISGGEVQTMEVLYKNKKR